MPTMPLWLQVLLGVLGWVLGMIILGLLYGRHRPPRSGRR